MKKTTILAAALGLALLCLVRVDLVAKEPAEKANAETAPSSKSADVQSGAQLGAQLGALTGAAVGARLVPVPVLAGEGRLGSLAARDVVLLRRQALAPFFFRKFQWFAHESLPLR